MQRTVVSADCTSPIVDPSCKYSSVLCTIFWNISKTGRVHLHACAQLVCETLNLFTCSHKILNRAELSKLGWGPSRQTRMISSVPLLKSRSAYWGLRSSWNLWRKQQTKGNHVKPNNCDDRSTTMFPTRNTEWWGLFLSATLLCLTMPMKVKSRIKTVSFQVVPLSVSFFGVCEIFCQLEGVKPWSGSGRPLCPSLLAWILENWSSLQSEVQIRNKHFPLWFGMSLWSVWTNIREQAFLPEHFQSLSRKSSFMPFHWNAHGRKLPPECHRLSRIRCWLDWYLAQFEANSCLCFGECSQQKTKKPTFALVSHFDKWKDCTHKAMGVCFSTTNSVHVLRASQSADILVNLFWVGGQGYIWQTEADGVSQSLATWCALYLSFIFPPAVMACDVSQKPAVFSTGLYWNFGHSLVKRKSWIVQTRVKYQEVILRSSSRGWKHSPCQDNASEKNIVCCALQCRNVFGSKPAGAENMQKKKGLNSPNSNKTSAWSLFLSVQEMEHNYRRILTKSLPRRTLLKLLWSDPSLGRHEVSEPLIVKSISN